jgi:hypothetical protein
MDPGADPRRQAKLWRPKAVGLPPGQVASTALQDCRPAAWSTPAIVARVGQADSVLAIVRLSFPGWSKDQLWAGRLIPPGLPWR